MISNFLLAELNEVLDKLKKGPSESSQKVETSDTSGHETDASQVRRMFLSKKTFRMKKVYAATELGRFFVTGPSDGANMPRHFYCRLRRKNVPVFTHGHHEVLRFFQGRRHFARDQRLRLETPGWRVLDFQGNPLSGDELERQREKIQKGPLVVRDREHPFAEDLITYEAGVIDPQLPVLAKVSCLVDAMKTGGSSGLVGAVCPNRRASELRSSLDTGRSFSRFRRFPEPLRLMPGSHCCFVFSLSILLECCPEFCREWLVWQRLTIFTALNSRSVGSHFGLSCGRARRALSVGLL